MNSQTIFIYRDLKELRKIQEERRVFPFILGKNDDVIDSDFEVCVDISSLMYLLISNKNNICYAYANFQEINDETIVIVKETLAESALELLPLLFSNLKYYFEEEGESVKSADAVEHGLLLRKKIFKYNNSQNLNKIIRYSQEHNIPIATFSQANGDLRKEFEQLNSTCELAILDLTSVSYAIEDNKTLIYLLEQFLNSMPNIKVIAQTSQIDSILKYFPLFFDGQEPVFKLIPELDEIEKEEIEENEKKKIVKITDLQEQQFSSFIESFNHNLIGHSYFKERMQYALNNFVLLNRAKEQKILSIFLYGKSGIGKTEVARLIADELKNESYLAKINFQNYSSQDALNSLIGSPAGYVGCNHGELSEKIHKSEVGVLLCDEFEKTTRPVYSFFLELLEEGHFTDSMAREYDMNGYIVIFTSNISSETEYKKIIPPELQTRFDLVCEFETPTAWDKRQFLDLLLEKAKKKYSEQFLKIKMTENERKKLYNFDYESLDSLRDIKRAFNNRLMDLFKKKEVL